MRTVGNHGPTCDEQLGQLISAAQSGDEGAYAELYDQFVQSIYRLAHSVLLNQEDAEEVAQDSFIYAFQNLRRYDPLRSAFRTWLYMIAMSRCRNRLRRRYLPTQALNDIADWVASVDPHPEAVAEQRSGRETILKALAKLSPKLREAAVLRYFHALTYREIAQVLGCPQKTAESRVRLAHEALHKLLKDQREILAEGVWTHVSAY